MDPSDILNQTLALCELKFKLKSKSPYFCLSFAVQAQGFELKNYTFVMVAATAMNKMTQVGQGRVMAIASKSLACVRIGKEQEGIRHRAAIEVLSRSISRDLGEAMRVQELQRDFGRDSWIRRVRGTLYLQQFGELRELKGSFN
ncbi:hypothetical protein M5K25_026298 [Dendrobium thyrsiflorum]|uniref:Uncharacterized protein n=1 Tax=Dendrobium thyrsiflorum TaxID=117978 RepID=A0ABD0TX39_DENTH